MAIEDYIKNKQIVKPVLPILDWGTAVYAAADVATKNELNETTAKHSIYIALRESLLSLLNFCQHDSAIIFIDGSNNFRKVVDPGYKISRINRPKYLDLAKDIASSRFGAIKTNGYEADDAVIVVHNHYSKMLHIPCAIASIDKDLTQVPSLFVRLPTVKTPYEAFAITTEMANDNLLMQILKGDSGDDVKGLPGVGNAEAFKIINGMSKLTFTNKDGVIEPLIPSYTNNLNTYDVKWLRVVEAYRNYRVPVQYLSHLPDTVDRMEYLIRQTRLVTMLRHIENFIMPKPTIFKRVTTT